jgi:membrane fusion protein, multidrug efflux system
MMPGSRWVTPLATAALLLLISGCQDANAPDEEPAKDEDESLPVPVEALTPVRGDVFAVYSGTASLESDEEAEVAAKVGGEVIEIRAEEGDRVKAGQLLARLDGDRLRLEAERSNANVKKLEQEYNRNVELHERGLVSVGAFEDLKFQLDSLRAAHKLAKLELGYTEIRAPIDGVISERFIKVGNTISPNDPVFRITDMDPLLAYLFVPEREYRKLSPGQVAELSLDALAGQRFEGTILRISPVVDPDTGTFKVTIAVPDEGMRLKPGMFGRFHIVYDSRSNVLLIPRAAIVEEENSQHVFVVEDEKAVRKTISTGFTRGDMIEVSEGLVDGDSVIIMGQSGLKDGAAVNVVTTGAVDAG